MAINTCDVREPISLYKLSFLEAKVRRNYISSDETGVLVSFDTRNGK